MSPINKIKLNKLRKRLDNLDNDLLNIIKKRSKLVNEVLKLKKYKNEIFLNGKIGDVLIFDGNLWHGGSSKSTNTSRWAIILGYARWFMKPSYDYMLNTPLKFFNKMSKSQKALLPRLCKKVMSWHLLLNYS